ncbi:DUF945 family protein [Vibrio genomosp. F10 str. 9ZC157]|uniref:DUF945 domain-containing protein n=2 Tax=Vibrio genomosp. F10 TaxID=723171 RepID=A0A1E5BHR2_9VIBR|nr:DUF945 family protein [Vibrio genomosp. F10]OEE36603.1 hypothetical protein A1QO_18600 [Vibrio genomosp. F10 str. ZF-129]OEE95303.1 hypothetical protein A1QM_05170 [Vibrio genomosp. F10 str. 9ZC157]
MKQLKKIGAISGAVLVALCWPLAVGQIGQRVITDGVTHLSNDLVSAEIIDYDRGYLNSTVQTRYALNDVDMIAQFEADGLPTEVVVNSVVKHGLLSLDAHSSLEGSEFPLTVNTVTQLNGNTDYTVNLANWYYRTQGVDELAISVSPSTITGNITVLGQLAYQLNMPSIELDFSTGEKLILTDVVGQGEGKNESGFWLGNQSMSIEKFTISDSTAMQTSFEIEKGQYQFTSELNNEQNRLTSNHKVTMGSLFTPDGSVDDFSLDFSMGDIDSVAFERLMSLYQSNPIMTEEDIAEAIPYVESLFSQGFYLAMNKMSLKVGEGEFESMWKLSVPQGTDQVSQDPSKILPALTGNISTYFSNQLVMDFPFIKQGIDEAVVMEIIQQTEQGYRITAELKEANVVFESGQEIPLMSLLLPMLMQ